MKNLIEALEIFLKYDSKGFPIEYFADTICISNINKDIISKEDLEKLLNLGFFWSETSKCFKCFTYRSNEEN